MRRRQIIAARSLQELPALLKTREVKVDEAQEQKAPATFVEPVKVSEPKKGDLVGVYVCPKGCGRTIKRGMYFHLKGCKGPK